MELKKPGWLIKSMKSGKNVPDQITILNKNSAYNPISTGNGIDGKPQVAMPVERMLHEKEIVLNAATADALGGKKGVKNLVMSALSEKGINHMPMPKESTVRQAASNNASKAGYVVGMPDIRKTAGYVSGSFINNGLNNIKKQTTTDLSINTAPTPATNISAPTPAPTPTTPTFTAAPTLQIPTVQTPQQAIAAPTVSMPAINMPATTTPNTAPELPKTTIQQAAVMPTLSTPTQSPEQAVAQARQYGFKSVDDAKKASDMQLGATDYYAEMAARNSSTTPTMPTVAPRGMDTFKKTYDYAAQQADARSAVADQALGMKMAQNPNLTEGAKNTMLQEAAMAKGSQQSKLAGDAAQQAYGIQREQNQKAMDAMMAAGDIDGFAKLYQQEYGITINTDAMKSTLNQQALSYATNGLNKRIAELNDQATLDDPVTKSYLESLWSATGNTGTMDTAWANNYLQRQRDSYSPVYQAMKYYPEDEARTLWGDATIDNMVDEITGTTGYEAFQRKYARGMATAFSSYDPATQDFKIANDSFLESLFNPQTPNVPIAPLGNTEDALAKAKEAGFNSVEEYNASLNKIVDYKSLSSGSTVGYNGKKWTVGQDVDGSKILLSSDGTWARVDSKNNVIPYTGDNNTGLQTIGGKTYNNGVEITASVGGNTLAINKDGEGNFVTVGTQRVPVTVSENGDVSIEGSFVNDGKLYINGKEATTPGGGTLHLDSGEAAKLSSGSEWAFADSGGKYYKVYKNGTVSEYTADDFTEDVSGMNRSDASMAIERLRANNQSGDAIWEAYKTVGDKGIDLSILNKIIGSSSKAQEWAVSKIGQKIGDGIVSIATVPGLAEYASNNSKSASIGGSSYRISAPYGSKRSYAGFINVDGKYYYVTGETAKDRQFRTSNGGADGKTKEYDYYKIAYDENGNKVTLPIRDT